MERWWGYRQDIARLREQAEVLAEPYSADDLSLLAYLRAMEGHASEALVLAKEALTRYFGEGDEVLYSVLATALDETGHFDDARSYFGQAATLFEEKGDRSCAIDCRSDIGLTWHRQSEFVRALAIQEQCREESRQLGHPRGEAAAWNRIGNAQDRLGDYPAALEAHQASLALRRELQDGRGEAVSLGNIGNVHLQLGDYDEALQWLEASLARSREVGFQKMYFVALGNKGLALHGKKDYEAARRCHEESLRLKKPLGDVQGEANTLGNLANVLIELGQTDAARERLDEALVLNRRMGDRHSEVHNLLTLARLASPAEAHAALERALRLAEEIHSRELAYLSHEALAAACKALGAFEQALAHHEAFHRIKEEVFHEATTLRNQQLQARQALGQARKAAELQKLKSDELEAALELAERLAREDGLTGLLNRRVGMERLTELHRHHLRHHRPLSVIVCDIDHFKHINDRFLHATGDVVLREVARLLREACRASDVVARLGGEEFLIVLPETDAEAARALCGRVREAIATHDWSAIHPGLSASLSFGLCADGLCEDAEQLLRRADTRLYEAKSAGRDCVRG